MPLQIPTTQELITQYISNFESRLNQTIPLVDKAFVRVLSVAEAVLDTSLYKFGVERSLQTLALTATDDDLDVIGNNYGVYRKVAESAEYRLEGSATSGTIIPIGVDFVGDSNNERYVPKSSATADITDTVSIDVAAKNPGTDGNIVLPSTMTIGRQIAGVLSTTFTITEELNLGVNRESNDAYRRRVLNEIRTVGGGGNSADYRTWAEETPGVLAAYPYSGKPVGEGTDLPGDRTVYIESTEAIDPDGIPPQSLLDEAEQTILFDPITGLERPPLGTIADTLFVRAIRRTGFYTEVRGMIIDSSIEAQVKTDIANALSQYYRAIKPFIQGLDFEGDKNDTISSLTVSTVVQDVLIANGGAASSIGFGLNPGIYEAIYQLGQGELAKSLGVIYV
jgi:hypothetical protein